MDNFENNELELAQEAQTLNEEKDVIEEGLDAARIQISTSKKDDRIQVNEITSSTKTIVEQPHMDFPFLVDDNTISWIRSNHVMFFNERLARKRKIYFGKSN